MRFAWYELADMINRQSGGSFVLSDKIIRQRNCSISGLQRQRIRRQIGTPARLVYIINNSSESLHFAGSLFFCRNFSLTALQFLGTVLCLFLCISLIFFVISLIFQFNDDFQGLERYFLVLPHFDFEFASTNDRKIKK